MNDKASTVTVEIPMRDVVDRFLGLGGGVTQFAIAPEMARNGEFHKLKIWMTGSTRIRFEHSINHENVNTVELDVASLFSTMLAVDLLLARGRK